MAWDMALYGGIWCWYRIWYWVWHYTVAFGVGIVLVWCWYGIWHCMVAFGVGIIWCWNGIWCWYHVVLEWVLVLYGVGIIWCWNGIWCCMNTYPLILSSPYGMCISLCVHFQNIAVTLTTGNDTTTGGKWIKDGRVNNPDRINEVCSVFIFSWLIYLVLILCWTNSEIL